MANKNQSFPWVYVVSILILAYIYAIIRYHYFGNTPIKDFPLYITNKVIALTSVVLFLSYLFNKKNIYLGGLSYILAFGHLIISLLILSPVYYKKFFSNEFELNAIANLSLFAGVLSFTGLWVYHQIKKGNVLYKIVANKKLHYFILTMLFLHLFFMGYKEWVQPLTWKGYLPPISLLTAIVVLVGFFRK